MNTIIKANGAKYLSQLMTDLPHNCLFNKVLTGSGGTTVALTNNEDYVICVPFKALISSKMSQVDNILGVMGGVKDADIIEYLETSPVKKIMVTYDSLPRLLKFIDPTQYRLLVDEAHKLIDSGSFRGTAIRGVLDNFNMFKSYTFMTATPVKDKYQLPALKALPKVTVNWDDITPVSVQYKMFESDLNRKMASIIIDYLNGNLTGNPYIFINSVKSIVKIVTILKKAGYNDPNLFKIVVATSESNIKAVKALGSKYMIESVNAPNKRVTFLTATAFEGCDIYDEDGITYVLTDGRKDHTKIDILTLLPQIIGRIRNSKLKDSVNVMYTPSPYFSYITEDEFEAHVKEQLEEANSVVEAFNANKSDKVRQMLLDGSEVDPYLIAENGEIRVNETAWYAEMHNFESLHTTYYVKKQNGKPVERTDSFQVSINSVPYNYQPASISTDVTLADDIKLDARVSFQKVCEKYCEDKAKVGINNLIMTVDADEDFNLIQEAYEVLGPDKLKALQYRKGKIQEALIVHNKETHNTVKIVNLLKLRVGQFVSLKELKANLSTIYNSLGINKAAKATDIKEWYNVKESSRRVDGKKVKGYDIVTVPTTFKV